MRTERIIVEKEKNQLILSFNHLLYKNEFIDKAIDDFKEICDIIKIDDKLVIKPKVDVKIETLGYEFYNYVLCLIKNV